MWLFPLKQHKPGSSVPQALLTYSLQTNRGTAFMRFKGAVRCYEAT